MVYFKMTQAGYDTGWTLMDIIGYLPTFVSAADPRPAREQMDDAYAHGGGWRPSNGFALDANDGSLHYPDDPPMPVLAAAELRDETINVYPHAWVGIVQKDGSFEVCRMD